MTGLSNKQSMMQIKLGAVLGYINYGIKIIVQLLYVPIMLRILDQNEYGVYQLVASLVSYLSLLNFGFGGAYFRFYARCQGHPKKEGELNGTFLMLFSLFAILAFVVGGILTLNSYTILGTKLSVQEHRLAKVLFAILTFNMALTFPGSVLSSIISAREQFVFLRLVEMIKQICSPFLTIALLLQGYGSVGIVLTTTVLSFIGNMVNCFYVLRVIKAPFYFGSLNLSLVKEVGVFSVFIFLNSIIDQINWNVDKFLLGRFVGAATIAIYSIAMHINDIFVQITDLLASTLAPRVNLIVASGEKVMEKLNDLFVRVGRLQSIIVFAVVAGFSVLGRDFIYLWAGEGYESAYYITLLLIGPVSIPLCQTLGVDIQRALNKHQARSVIYAGMALLNLLLSIPLTKAFGGVGAAFGTTCSLLLGNGLVMNVLYQKYIGLRVIPFWKEILKLIPCVFPPVVGCIVVKGLFQSVTWGVICLCVLVFVVLYAGALWLFGINQREKDILHSAFFNDKRKRQF